MHAHKSIYLRNARGDPIQEKDMLETHACQGEKKVWIWREVKNKFYRACISMRKYSIFHLLMLGFT